MSFITKAVKALGKLLGHLFGGFYKEAEMTLASLPQSDQDNLKHGSGFIAVLNATVGKTPDVIRDTMLEMFPDVNFPAIETAVFHYTQELGLGKFKNFSEAAVALQTYLNSRTSKAWAIASFAASAALAVFMSPPETKVQVITNLIETAYQKWIKPLFDKK